MPPMPKRMHHAMNPVIAVTGEMAVARSHYLVMVEGPDGPAPSVRGTCADQLIRAPEEWRFRRRELIHGDGMVQPGNGRFPRSAMHWHDPSPCPSVVLHELRGESLSGAPASKAQGWTDGNSL